MSDKWTEREDDVLSNLYGKIPAEEVACRLGRTRKSVVNRAWRIGVNGDGHRWSDSEIEQVRVAYEASEGRKLDLNRVCEVTGRGRSEVCRKARELGLTDKSRMKTDTGPIDKRMFKGDRKALSEHISQRVKDRFYRNGHPRGMAGKKHSVETKKVLSQRSKEMWEARTQEQKDAAIMKAIQTRRENGFEPPKTKRGTWAAGWRQVGDKRHYFRSAWEANYARYLEWLKSIGEIRDWAYEPEVFWFEQIKRGVRSYKPDFRVWETDGSSALHEVKGWMDSRSKTTLRRMAKYHPSETIILIDEKQYKAIRMKVMGLVDGWEDSSRDRRI